MPVTAKRHFDEDLARATDVLNHASTPRVSLRDELSRQSWAMAVGAMDAYLCDAYVDVLSRVLKGYRDHRIDKLPSGYVDLNLPVGKVLARDYTRSAWGFRNAARALMEKDNMLRISRIRDTLNPALPAGQKFWERSVVESLLGSGASVRLTGISLKDYQALPPDPRDKQVKAIGRCVPDRLGSLIQRRHDIVHNCDRPKSKPQRIGVSSARSAIADIGSFVAFVDAHLEAHRIAK